MEIEQTLRHFHPLNRELVKEKPELGSLVFGFKTACGAAAAASAALYSSLPSDDA